MSFSLKQIKSKKSTQDLSLQEVKYPQKVRALILNQIKLAFQDFYFLKGFTNIIKLDLSYNKINQFPQGFSFQSFTSLKTLFLHYNRFDRLKNLELLSDCSGLVYLTLFGNPINQSTTRHFLINLIPTLKLMDDKPVKQEQKHFGFFNFSFYNFIHERTGFPLIETTDKQNKLEFMVNILRQIKIANDYYQKVNPIVIIQKWWKKQKIKQQKKNKYSNKTQIINKFNKTQITENLNQAQNFQNLKIAKKNSRNYEQYQIENEKNIQQREEISNVFKNIKQKNQCQSISSSDKKNQLKILRLFQTFNVALSSFQILLHKNNSLFCSKQQCQLKGYKYKPIVKFMNKSLVIYKTPQLNPIYSISKQKNRKFFLVALYNNYHYLVQLKNSNYQFSIQKQRTQLKNVNISKNISEHNQKKIEIVQIDLTIQQKMKIIKKEYKNIIYKKDKQKIFPFLFGICIIKINSALKIQKIWRGYIIKKKFKNFRNIKQQKAAFKIQKSIRKLNYYHRQQFLLKMYSILKTNDSSNIFMTIETFCQLQHKYQQALLKKKLFKFPFQDCQFRILQTTSILNKLNQKQGEQFGNYQKNLATKICLKAQRQPFPSYFQKFASKFLLLSLQKEQLPTRQKEKQTLNKNSTCKILDILIKGSKSIDKFIKVDSQNSDQKTIFLRFSYQNKSQANQRKLLLSLLTYSYRSIDWIPFIQQNKINPNYNHIEVLNQVNNSYFIKMIYDKKKDEKLLQKIQQQRKKVNAKSGINWIPVRVRYYECSVDLSAIVVIGTKDKKDEEKEQIKADQNKPLNYLQRKKMKQMRSLKKLSQKMTLSNLDTSLINPYSLANKKIQNPISLSIPLNINIQFQDYIKQLQKNNDQNIEYSKFSINKQQQIQNSQYNSSLSYLQQNIQYENNKNVQKNNINNSQTQLKKFFVSQIKNLHKQKIINAIKIKKQIHHSVRIQYITNNQQNKKLISQSSIASFIENVNKVKKVHNYKQNINQNRQQITNFENKFIRQGNSSIQNSLRNFQKIKSRTNSQNNSAISKSSRYKQQSHINSDQKQQNVKSAKIYFKSKRKNQSELKQFSLSLSGGLNSQTLEMQLPLGDQIDVFSDKNGKNKKYKLDFSDNFKNQTNSPKVGNYYYQQRLQFLKSQADQKKYIKENELGQSQLFDNYQINSYDQKRSNNQYEQIENYKYKKMKKKRIVHSVFPQEFFPLKQSQKIGFRLPKIDSHK